MKKIKNIKGSTLCRTVIIPQNIYILKLDVAKELSMLSRSEKGKTIHPRIIRKKKYSRTRRFTKLTFKGLSIPLFLLLKFII